ncbi:Histidine kinase [Quillaja saponaria]|uniref:histidine kinase n=1 Tax=Quillaja saponaria TaxID=32244 RepID=A0AAD7LLD1_QUISA|nr:Histidine kinase [Quillaja saponaria]
MEALQSAKQRGSEMLLSNCIACTVNVLCPVQQEFQKEDGWIAEIIEPIDRCPIGVEYVQGKLDLPLLKSRVWADRMLVGDFSLKLWRKHKHKQQQQSAQDPPKGAGKWRKKLLVIFVALGIGGSIWLFWYLTVVIYLRREETLANMCDERARMLQDQFNVSLNHVHALAILVSTFHHGKHPSAIDQKTFGKYTERMDFERPLTSGVAYALKILHSEGEIFERQHGWKIRKINAENQTLVQDCIPENLDPAPIQDEYAPVIFSRETVSHIVSIDMMSGKEDHENILQARASGKGVLTSPFKLLKSNHVGVVFTFAVYDSDLPADAAPEQRIEANVGYLGASYDVPSLVEKLLHQLASKQTIVVNVYDTTDATAPINVYGTDVTDTGLLHISNLDFGDPLRKHEMHCRFKQKPPLPWTTIISSGRVLVITLLVGHIFLAAIRRIAKVEEDYREMMRLKVRAEAADVAKSQFLVTVSHEIRTPMNGALGNCKVFKTAHASGKDLISLMNEVLDQAKIESGRLELEAVRFDLRAVLDNVLSLFSGKSNEQGIEFTNDKGHIFVLVHLASEVRDPHDIMDEVLRQSLNLVQDVSNNTYNTLSGFPVVDRWKSWECFEKSCSTDMDEPEIIKLLVTVEDTGLSISKRLVNLMGGEISFVSERGTGSSFSFTGTFRKGATGSLDTMWQHYDHAISEFQGLRALVIDKRSIRAEVTRYYMQRLGISLDIASSLKSACSYLSKTCETSMSPLLAMILIDKDVCDKETGLLFHHSLKEKWQISVKEESVNFLKIYLLATSISTQEHEVLKSVGFVDNVLMKPLRLSVLIACFQDALGNGEKRQVKRKKDLGNFLRERYRKVAEGALKKYGAIVNCVESGSAAIETLEPPHNFDACFMDLQMPQMDGFEATRKICCLESKVNEELACGKASAEMLGGVAFWHTPILAMTADVIRASNEECMKCGMDYYVSKPFEGEQLYKAVARFFESG